MRKTYKIDEMIKTDAFPVMPQAATKLYNILQNSKSDLTQIEGVLRYEPALTANILKLTNSAYFGLLNRVGSIKQAIVLLGREKLIELVMLSCVNAMMNKTVPGYSLQAGELWRHSIAVSVAAEGLMKELKLPVSEKTFTAALLHDLGKLVLGKFVKDEFNEIAEEASKGTSFEVAERMVLGTDHAEIGAKILTKWAFPAELVSAIRWHHQPDSAEKTSNLIDIVHVANVLCLMIGIGVGTEELCYEPSLAATKRLGIKTYHIERVASSTLQWIEELSDVFS